MGQPISETRKAQLLQRAEMRLNFARNLPVDDPTREGKVRAAEKALQTAVASKTVPDKAASDRKARRKKPRR
jgi:hypothetical protein